MKAYRRNSVRSDDRSNNFTSWKLDILTDHIVGTHHHYILSLLQEIAHLHGKVNAGYGQFQQTILHFLNTLMVHLKKEEDVLFPKIKQLVNKKINPKIRMGVPVGFVKNGAIVLLREHETAIEFLQLIRSITNDYELPAVELSVYYALFEKLQEFEEDLFVHMQLEKTILFPGAAALEFELATRG